VYAQQQPHHADDPRTGPTATKETKKSHAVFGNVIAKKIGKDVKRLLTVLEIPRQTSQYKKYNNIYMPYSASAKERKEKG